MKEADYDRISNLIADVRNERDELVKDHLALRKKVAAEFGREVTHPEVIVARYSFLKGYEEALDRLYQVLRLKQIEEGALS